MVREQKVGPAGRCLKWQRKKHPSAPEPQKHSSAPQPPRRAPGGRRSGPKKSGKTEIKAIVQAFFAYNIEAPNEIITAANKREQAVSRAFKRLKTFIERNPFLLTEAASMIGNQVTLKNGTTVLAFDPSSTRAVLDSPSPGLSYTVTIRAVDTAGNGSSPNSLRFETYPDEGPPPPAAVVAHDTGTGGSVIASWTIPDSRVPIARFIVRYEPLEPGWPEFVADVNDPRDERAGLVNHLRYLVHVRGVTPWGRKGQSTSSSVVVPTAPALPLPILERTGRVGDDGLEDSAGIQIVLPSNQFPRPYSPGRVRQRLSNGLHPARSRSKRLSLAI